MTPVVSRRTLLRGGAAIGVVTALGGTRIAHAAPGRIPRLLLDYRPSRPTGWPGMPGQDLGATIGGHTTATEFSFNGKPHRISLLPLGPGNSADPLYEDVPADPDLNFRHILAGAFGAHYSFRYVGLRGRQRFRVQSYSVFANEATPTSPGTGYGGDLYVVYDSPDPTAHDDLQWIQVVNWSGGGRPPEPVLDNIWRANPFFIYGGLTSIHGAAVVNFHDVPQAVVAGDLTLDDRFVSESFLVEDTGKKDARGKAVVNVLGGIKWGWRVQRSRTANPAVPG